MILTWELIESGRSDRGGWSRKQLAVFGVRWPLKKGWKRRLLGKRVTPEQVERFLELRNVHLNRGQLEELDHQFLEATVGI